MTPRTKRHQRRRALLEVFAVLDLINVVETTSPRTTINPVPFSVTAPTDQIPD
jgi:hypothetical protein